MRLSVVGYIGDERHHVRAGRGRTFVLLIHYHLRRKYLSIASVARRPLCCGHVLILAASIRSLEHLLYCFALETELATVPAKILEQWASKNFPMPDKQFPYKSPGKPIPYDELDLERPWETFDIQHELTRKGVEKLAADCRAMLSRPA